MAVLRIAKMGNPVLMQVAAPVEDPTAPEIKRLAADMQETLEDIGASGLAAPQVFVAKRVVVYRMIAARIPAGSGIQYVAALDGSPDAFAFLKGNWRRIADGAHSGSD